MRTTKQRHQLAKRLNLLAREVESAELRQLLDDVADEMRAMLEEQAADRRTIRTRAAEINRAWREVARELEGLVTDGAAKSIEALRHARSVVGLAVTFPEQGA